jgi:hypothetical protein
MTVIADAGMKQKQRNLRREERGNGKEEQRDDETSVIDGE